MTKRTRTVVVFGTGALVLVLLIGLGARLLVGGPPADNLNGSAVGTWPTSDDPLTPTGDVTATGDTIALPDGTGIDVGEEIEVYVVGGAGVFFVPADDQGESWPELMVATPSGVCSTGARPDPDTLHTSPNGRYLAFIERGRKPAAAVVVDLRKGKEIVRSTEGMGNPLSPPELYDNEPPDVYGVTNTSAYFSTPDGAWSWNLVIAEPSFEGNDLSVIHGSDWYTELSEPGATFGPRAPSPHT